MPNRRKAAIIGFGAGQHAKVMIEALHLAGGYDVIGLLDPDASLHGTEVMGVPVLGRDDLAMDLRTRGVGLFFVGVGTTGDTRRRQQIYMQALQYGLAPVAVRHPTSIVSPSAMIDVGVTILAGAILGTSACLGCNVLINTGAIVEHDCIVGDHAHIATGVCLAGGVVVGAGAHVGIGASVRQGIEIGARAVIGAGAAVVKNVLAGQVVAGVPARVLRQGLS